MKYAGVGAKKLQKAEISLPPDAFLNHSTLF